MNLVDVGIAICGFALIVTCLPTLLDKNSQVPRWKSSIPTALILSILTWLFGIAILPITSLSVGIEAIMWWAIAILRPIKPKALNMPQIVIEVNR